jgi:hypothetical protein
VVAEGAADQIGDRMLVSRAVLIRSLYRFAYRRSRPLFPLPGNGSALPMNFSKGLTSERTGRITVRSCSTTNSTRSPVSSPRRLCIACGTVIWPLLLIVLEFFIFT